MSRDIRSFFSTSKAKASTTLAPAVKEKQSSQKRNAITLDSDSDDEKPKVKTASSEKPKQNGSSGNHKKRRIIEDSSDEEDDRKTAENRKGGTLASKVAKLSVKPAENKKLKEVNVSNAFGNEPVKRVEKEKKSKSKNNDKSLLDADDLDLSNIDDSLLETEDTKPTKKTPSKDKKSDEKKTPKKEQKRSEPHNNEENSMKDVKSNERRTAITPSKESKHQEVTNHKSSDNSGSPSKNHEDEKNKIKDSHKRKKTEETTPSEKRSKKTPKQEDEELDYSVYDPDQERAERKRAAAVLYKQFQKRSGPAHPGSKEIPKGKSDCLAGLTFVITGVLDSMERDEAASVIRDFGGKVTSALSKKTNYLVAGEESGPAKIAKAEENGTVILSEDDLLDLIRIKSDMPPLQKKGNVKMMQDEGKDEIKIKKEKDLSPVKKEKTPKKKVEYEIKKEKLTPKKTNEVKPIEKDVKIKEEIQQNKEKNLDGPQVWVEKYKPQAVKEIIGQQGTNSNCEKLLKWLSNWHKNQKSKTKPQRPNPWAKNDDGSSFKAALLSGPPGVGKTTTAQLVCKQLGFDTIEFNASDTRSKKLLREEVSELLSNKTIHAYVSGQNKSLTEKQVLIMDEVDGMAGNEDRGGMQELIGLIKSTSVPIICMCNDRNHPKIRSLLNYCFDLRFQRPRLEQIKSAIMSICFKEKVKIPPKIIDDIITATNHDVRQTINSISMIAARPDLIEGKIKANDSKKDLKLGPWDVIRKVFSAEDHKTMTMNDKSDLFFHDYSLAPLFVQQTYLTVAPNVPKSQVMDQVALTADSLSLGDLVDKRIRSQMAWSMLPIQAMYSSVLPGEYMEGRITAQINFPAWLGKNSKTQKRNRLAQELHDHTRIRTSGSRQSMRLDYAPFLLKNIVQPMIDDKTDGIEEALNVMKEYRLLREDIDSLVELTTWPGKKNLMESVDGKVKAALTRAYNKEVAPYSYSAVSGVKKKKGAASGGGDEDFIAELNGLEDDGGAVGSSDEECDDDIEHNALIKTKKTTRSQTAKASASSASTSKKVTATRKKK